MINSPKNISAFCFLSMFFLGVGVSLVGSLASNLGLSPFEIFLFTTIQNVGLLLSLSFIGTLADQYPMPRLLWIGSLILGSGFLSFFASDLIWLNLGIIFCIGIGMGIFEGVTDPLLVDLFPGKENFYIGVNHFFVTLGSSIIVIYLVFLALNWRVSLVQSGIIVLILAVAFLFTQKKKKSNPQKNSLLGSILLLKNEKILFILFLTVTLLIGVEFSMVGVLTTFLIQIRGLSLFDAKIGLVIFFVTTAIARLIFSYIIRKEQVAGTILILLGFSFLFFSAFFFWDLGKEGAYVLIFLGSFVYSSVLPLLISLVGDLYQKLGLTGTALGAIKLGIPMGGISLPLFLSFLSESWELKEILIFFPGGYLLGFLLYFSVWWKIRRPAI